MYWKLVRVKHTQFAELAVGDEELSQGAETLQSLIPLLLGGLLVYRGVGAFHSIRVELLRLPDEVLDQVALVLGQEKILHQPDNLSAVGHKVLSIIGKFVGWRLESLGLEEAV